MDKVTRPVSTNHNLFEEKGEAEAVSNGGPSTYQPNALPLGHTRLTKDSFTETRRLIRDGPPSFSVRRNPDVTVKH